MKLLPKHSERLEPYPPGPPKLGDSIPADLFSTALEPLAEVEQLVVNGVMAGFAALETRKRIVEEQVRPAFANT